MKNEKENKLSRFFLKFSDRELDKKYNEKYFSDSIKLMRYASLFAMFLYALFGLPDIIYMDSNKLMFIYVRYFIFIPFLISVYFITYSELFKKYGQVLFSITIYLTGMSILLMAFQELPFSLHFVGFILALIFCFNFSRLLFKYSFFTSILLIITFLGYALWIVYVDKNEFHLNILLYYFVIYAAVTISGIFTSYSIERLNKEAFLQQIIINKSNLELLDKNVLLYEQNELISNQNIELDELNKKLSEVNYEISLQNKELDALNSQVSMRNSELLDLNQKLKEANNSKNKFFSIISHDLKNSLSALMLKSEVAYKYFDKFSEKEKIENIIKLNSISKDLFSLLENLLKWSGTQTEKIEFNKEKILFSSFIKEILSYFDEARKIKNIKFELLNISNFEIEADVNMLRSVLINLISNSIKFSYPDSKIQIGIDIKKDGIIENRIFFVRDFGMGMPDEVKNKIFRIDENITTLGTNGEKGTGLGLILCKEFIEMHNGKIWIDSDKGKGSTFYFTLSKQNLDWYKEQ